ncbi:unnamed protein product [Durusdinium trenchii]|uniref:UBC core domain-containing protein n=1 Tax=Durusdinium trenchii TaxID=1381693 RepID=A0ABP0PMF9_9DINO
MEVLKADLRLIEQELPQGTCQVDLVDSNLFHWEVALSGPEGTPYRGGTFRFWLWFPVEYPEKAPRLKCLTPMYHCNIDRNGSVCLDMDHELLQLKVAGPDPEVEQSSRSSAYCIVQALLSLFAAPVPENALVPDAGRSLWRQWRRRY